MERKPIKRNEHIVPLSREHHYGLLFCYKIRTGLKNNVDLTRIRSYINFFWDSHLQKHFKDEETLLFNRIDTPLCLKAKEQHVNISDQIKAINGTERENPIAYQTLEALVNDHTRLEERELFPYLESVLSQEDLQGVGKQLLKDREEHFSDDYPDEFWIK